MKGWILPMILNLFQIGPLCTKPSVELCWTCPFSECQRSTKTSALFLQCMCNGYHLQGAISGLCTQQAVPYHTNARRPCCSPWFCSLKHFTYDLMYKIWFSSYPAKRFSLKHLDSLRARIYSSSLPRCLSGEVSRARDLGEDSGHAWETMPLGWPGNILGSPQKRKIWVSMLGKWMNGWMDRWSSHRTFTFHLDLTSLLQVTIF